MGGIGRNDPRVFGTEADGIQVHIAPGRDQTAGGSPKLPCIRTIQPVEAAATAITGSGMRLSLATGAMSVVAPGLVDAGTPQRAVGRRDQFASWEDIPAPVPNDAVGQIKRADHAALALAPGIRRWAGLDPRT